MYTILCFAAIFMQYGYSLPTPPAPENPPVPAFLEDAPQPVINSFHRLIRNAHNLTDRQIDKAVEEWVEQQSDDIQSKWIAFQPERERQESEAARRHQAAYAKFSDEAQLVDAKLRDIASHSELTAREKFMMIRHILEKLPKSVKHEIENALFSQV